MAMENSETRRHASANIAGAIMSVIEANSISSAAKTVMSD